LRAIRAFALLFTLAALCADLPAASPRFFDDDPLREEPNTQDAAGVQPWALDLAWDLIENLFSSPGDTVVGARARNVNTIDEVPDGAWFTNRAGVRPLTAADVGRGPGSGQGPSEGRWAVVSAKSDGITPGFTIRDQKGAIWFLKFDPPGYRGMATGTEVTVGRLLWALGYHTPEFAITSVRLDALEIAEGTHITPPGGKPRQMREDDLGWLLRDSERDPDGSYRAIASLAVPGKPLGGFRFYGTRSDDPNDVFPHEHRRELRGYGVFAAWFNHVDAKSINSLDALVAENGRHYVRHYLIDFGSTLGSAAVAPREYWEGHEYLIEPGNVPKGILGLGFYGIGGRMTPTIKMSAIGRVDRDDTNWDPEKWKPRIPNPAFLRSRADDKFWAARRAAAISNEMLRAAVDAGRFGNSDAEAELVRVLRQRRDAIVARYLPAVNPIVDVALDDSGTLTFRNAAVDAGVAREAGRYLAQWASFDNATGATRPIGESAGAASGIRSPAGLPANAGAYVQVAIRGEAAQNPAWAKPVHAYFRRAATGWALVGFDRLPGE
jgi:hypothetical protein